MEYFDNVGLLDPDGKPFPRRIARALAGLLPRLRRQFAAICDEAIQLSILEKAGHLIYRRERRKGEIEEVHRYAWVAVRSKAIDYVRTSEGRVSQDSLEPDKSRLVFGQLPSDLATPEQIEQHVLLSQILDRLSRDERRVVMWKLAGKTSAEIAEWRGGTAGAVDVLYHRMLKRLRTELGGPAPDSADKGAPARSSGRVKSRKNTRKTKLARKTKKLDGKAPPAPPLPAPGTS